MSEDEFVVDMDEVEVKEGFEAVPAGWYQCMIDGYTTDREVKNAGGKLPVGTKGTNWEFTVVEGKYTNQKFWTCYWHHASTAGFFKGLYAASGAFEEDELEGRMDILAERDRAVGQELWVRVNKKSSKQYGDGNDVKAVKHLSEREAEPEEDEDD